MEQKFNKIMFIVFVVVYSALIIYNYLRGSQWIFDNLLSLGFLVFIFIFRGWLNVQKTEFTLFNFALLIHNLGTFGLYSLSYGVFQYDNTVHFISTIAAAYIVFNLITNKLCVKKHKKKLVIDEHTVIMIGLVISVVAMLGTFVEMSEYTGYLFLGPGEGILFWGSGDSDGNDTSADYLDTMNDTIANFFGAVTGVIFYYKTKYRKVKKCYVGSI